MTKIKLTEEQKELLHKLNPRQQKFVCNLVSGMNQTQAYKEAGYKPKSDDQAKVMASRLLTNVNVKAAYEALSKPIAESQAESAILSQDEALRILTEQARCSLEDVVHMQDVNLGEFDGETVTQTVIKIKDSNNLSARAKASIKSVTITNQGPKLELQCRQSAIKQLAGMLGWAKSSERDKDANDALKGFFDAITDSSSGNPAGVISGRHNDEA